MSLAETQQIMSMLQEIMQLLNGAEIKTSTLSKNIGYSSGGGGGMSLRRELRLINMYTVAVEKWSGSGTLAGVMNGIQQAEAAALRFYMLILAINALAAGPTPFGALYTGAMAIGFAISLQTLGQ
jgi:hypothetical protein